MNKCKKINKLTSLGGLILLGACGGGSGGGNPLTPATQRVVISCDDPTEGKIDLMETSSLGVSYISFLKNGVSIFNNVNGQDLSAFLVMENSGDSRSGHTTYFPQDVNVLSYDELVFESLAPFSEVSFTKIHWVKLSADDSFFPEPDEHYKTLTNCSVK